MNRFLISSALIGSVMGAHHGHIYRQHNSTPKQILLGVRDGLIGAAIFPFIIPIGVYQIAANTPQHQQCVFSVLFNVRKKSQTHTET
jgi:hydrogenase/urease accessory protein HupE